MHNLPTKLSWSQLVFKQKIHKLLKILDRIEYIPLASWSARSLASSDLACPRLTSILDGG